MIRANLFCTVGTLATAALLAVSASAAAQEPGERRSAGEASGEAAHFGNTVTLRLAYIESLRTVEPESEEAPAEREESRALAHHIGVGLGYERALVHGWLNLALSALAFNSQEGWEVPAGALLEVPFEWTEQVEAYLGTGLAVDLVRESDVSPHFGWAASAGLYGWASERLGANVDLEYRWLPNEDLVYDLTIGVAAAARF
ncbi:MAG TPA: hypothetical protein VFS67_16290 [Polyangiaceae bacterium]|jgi:hypothetical protein|nr:hypothetical protein [Polyangiaceae bacterium]